MNGKKHRTDFALHLSLIGTSMTSSEEAIREAGLVWARAVAGYFGNPTMLTKAFNQSLEDAGLSN